MSSPDPRQPVVWTVGHSNRTLNDLIHLIQSHGICRVIDVRRFPRSAANPQFNIETLPDALATAGIGYLSLPGLGGRRQRRPDSPNTGWRNPSFQGYADYLQTAEFAESFAKLLDAARRESVALMCAEALPWRCHRSLIGDALIVHGFRVEDILNSARHVLHRLPSRARVEGRHLTYPSASEANA
jgi:uncharacterized protein (DUF488 family)